MRLLAAAALLASSALCHAQENLAYGIEIGGPIPWRECAFMAGSTATFKVYDPIVKKACMRNLAASPQGGVDLSRRSLVIFPYADRPVHSASDTAEFFSVDGKVAAVAIDTEGLGVQERIFTDLVTKFGKPRILKRVPTQTVGGATFETIRAGWTSPTMRVDFMGAADRVDHGVIVIGNDAGFAEKAAREEKRNGGGKPL